MKIWVLPDDGLKVDLYQWRTDLHGHQRRVDYIEWHPTAENLLLSAGLDHQIVLWNIARAEPIQIYRCHSDPIQSISWNRNGSCFATTCRDKKIRIIEARTGRILAVDREWIDDLSSMINHCSRVEWVIKDQKHRRLCF